METVSKNSGNITLKTKFRAATMETEQQFRQHNIEDQVMSSYYGN